MVMEPTLTWYAHQFNKSVDRAQQIHCICWCLLSLFLDINLTRIMVSSPNFFLMATSLFSIKNHFCNGEEEDCLQLNLSQNLFGLAQVVFQLVKDHCYQDFLGIMMFSDCVVLSWILWLLLSIFSVSLIVFHSLEIYHGLWEAKFLMIFVCLWYKGVIGWHCGDSELFLVISGSRE